MGPGRGGPARCCGGAPASDGRAYCSASRRMPPSLRPAAARAPGANGWASDTRGKDYNMSADIWIPEGPLQQIAVYVDATKLDKESGLDPSRSPRPRRRRSRIQESRGYDAEIVPTVPARGIQKQKN